MKLTVESKFTLAVGLLSACALFGIFTAANGRIRLLHSLHPHEHVEEAYNANAAYLARELGNSPDWTQDDLDYIRQLHINDVEFYNVFNRSELYSLFRPTTNPQLPFYIWNEDKGLSQFVNATIEGTDISFLDSSISVYRDLIRSPWRVQSKQEALLHFVPVDESTRFAKWDSDSANKAITSVVNSPEWHQFNGSNFFWISSNYMNELRHELQSQKLFENLNASQQTIAELSPLTLFGQTAAALFQSSNVKTRLCGSSVPFSANMDLRNLTASSTGPLESYKHPGGIFAQVREQRPYNMIFYGQADAREAYKDRLALMNTLPGIWEPSILTIYKGGRIGRRREHMKSNGVFPACTNTTKMSGCIVPSNLQTDSMYSTLLKKSRFGYHLRGDEFSSARLSDIIAAQAIPVIVMTEALDISVNYQCYIPWNDIAVFVDRSEFIDDPVAVVKNRLMSLTTLDLEKRFRLLQFYREELIHGSGSLRAAHNALKDFAMTCVPEVAFRRFNLSKQNLDCPFGNRLKRTQWKEIHDEDDSAAWGSSMWTP